MPSNETVVDKDCFYTVETNSGKMENNQCKYLVKKNQAIQTFRVVRPQGCHMPPDCILYICKRYGYGVKGHDDEMSVT